MPAAHCVGVTTPPTVVGQYEPTGQGMQVVAPTDGAYDPTGQAVGVLVPAFSHDDPAGHAVVETLASGQYDPVGQSTHAVPER